MNSLASANPYVDLVAQFPGRIFPIRDFSQERAELQALVTRYPESILEIGSGSGNHLIAQAGLRPQAAFFGVELRFKRAVRTIEKSGELENIFVLRMNAKLLHRIFQTKTFSGLYINFPDPWSKRKTEKHRLLTVEFVSSLKGLLKPAAFVSIKTDDAEQFERFASRLDELHGFRTEYITRDLLNSDRAENDVCSEFQSLFHSKGIPICHAVVRCAQ